MRARSIDEAEPAGGADALEMPQIRQAQAAWASRPVRERVTVLDRARQALARDAERLAGLTAAAADRDLAYTLAAELLPLLDAFRWLRRRAPALLAEERPGSGRPLWLFGVRLRLRRDPFGVVLVIAPGNYPLLLAGVQTAQALAAGNAVLVKPAPGCAAPMQMLAAALAEAGLPAGVLTVLDDTPAAATAIIAAGVDKVVLTGGIETGRAVLGELAPRVVPAVMELSGADALLALPSARLDLVADAVAFGIGLNGGRTCIAPRWVFAPDLHLGELEQALTSRLNRLPAGPGSERAAHLVRDALARGARLVVGAPDASRPALLADVPAEAAISGADIFAPLAVLRPYASLEAAVEAINATRYGLGASVFGARAEAERVAELLDVGCVTVNDVIAPTADPRLPFGGRRASGFGVTRGAEGLLEMTRVKAIASRRPGRLPHLSGRRLSVRAWLRLIRLLHWR
jgi:acyl-CoA reductase-like NAD-dependent aldehyde dehydrogenase